MYRIFIWSSETGSVSKRKDYQTFSLAQKRAVEASMGPSVREVSLCEVNSKGEYGDRLGVARLGEWADGRRAPVVRKAGDNEAMARVKAGRRKRT